MKIHSKYRGYTIYKDRYLGDKGRMCNDFVAYKDGTNNAEVYKISRPSLKTLKKEIDT